MFSCSEIRNYVLLLSHTVTRYAGLISISFHPLHRNKKCAKEMIAMKLSLLLRIQKKEWTHSCPILPALFTYLWFDICYFTNERFIEHFRHLLLRFSRPRCWIVINSQFLSSIGGTLKQTFIQRPSLSYCQSVLRRPTKFLQHTNFLRVCQNKLNSCRICPTFLLPFSQSLQLSYPDEALKWKPCHLKKGIEVHDREVIRLLEGHTSLFSPVWK